MRGIPSYRNNRERAESPLPTSLSPRWPLKGQLPTLHCKLRDTEHVSLLASHVILFPLKSCNTQLLSHLEKENVYLYLIEFTVMLFYAMVGGYKLQVLVLKCNFKVITCDSQ